MPNNNYTYVKFDALDYTNTSAVSTYTLENTPLTFTPDFTTSSLLSGDNIISNKSLRWDFGDGEFSTDISPTHRFKWPGKYDVSLTVFDRYGNAYDNIYSCSISVYDYISTQITFQDYKSFIYDVPVGRLIGPLTINANYSWQNYNALSATGFTINLYASGARGDYNYLKQTSYDKWLHLRPLSRFYKQETSDDGTTSYTLINSLTAQQTQLFVSIVDNTLQYCNQSDQGSVFVGTTGTCQFLYTDDVPGNLTTEDHPVFIFATVDSSKFNDALTESRNIFDTVNYPPYGIQNTDPIVFPGIKTRFNPANRLSITTTGIDGEGILSATNFNIPYVSWQETQIPFLIKLKDERGYTTKNYPPLSSSSVVNNSTSPLTSYNVQLGVVQINESGDTSTVQGVTFYEDFTPEAPQSIGSFYKGYFVASQSSQNCILTAGITIVEPTFYQKDSLVGWIAIPQYSSLFRILRQETYNGLDGNKTVTFTNNEPLIDINDSNTYAIAMAPQGPGYDDDYQTWIGDPINDRISRIDYNGILQPLYYSQDTNEPVYYFSLSSVPTLINHQIRYIDYRGLDDQGNRFFATPNYITLDGQNNIWVTLIDSGSALKFDTTNGYAVNVACPDFTETMLTSSDYSSYSGFAGDGTILPSSIDADHDNNIWISYSHPVNNFLIKYRGVDNFDFNADILYKYKFPDFIVPDEICIDRNTFVWVTAQNLNVVRDSFTTANDLLYKFDTYGNIVTGYPLSGFKLINNITIDGNQNAWISHNRETITRVDGVTRTRTDFTAGAGNNIQNNYNSNIGGITCDTGNNIWVINNADKALYLIDASAKTPTTNLSYSYSIKLTYPDVILPAVSAVNYSSGQKQFQALGDWNGYHWINKYSAPVSTIRTITGSSTLFNIFPSTGQYNVSKINEDWNAASFYNSLRYQETLLDKQVFFNEFLGTIVGGFSAQPYELGKTVYEKISNFVNNRSDIDKSNIDALISFCNELSINYQDYNYLYPPQIKRLVDLLSIKQSNLWGTQNKYASNFNKQGTIASNDTYGINLGSRIDPISGVFSFDKPVVAYERFSGIYSLVNTNTITSSILTITDTITGYPLSAYTSSWGWPLVIPNTVTGSAISEYYEFYEYISNNNNTFYDYIIDWYNPMTTLTPQNSSYTDWSVDDGIIQNMLSYELTKGFRLFTSATNITYNS